MKRLTVIILAIIALLLIVWALAHYSQRRSQEKLIDNLKDLQTQMLTGTSENKLAVIRDRYVILAGKIPDGVVMTTITGNILEANPAYREMLGYSVEEIKKVTYQQITPKKWQAMEAEIVAAAADKKYVRFQKEYIKKDGTVFPIELTGWIIKDGNGDPIGTGSIVRGIKK